MTESPPSVVVERILESLVKIEKRLDSMEDSLSIVSQRFSYLSQVDDDIQNGLSLRGGHGREEDDEEDDNGEERGRETRCCCPCSFLPSNTPFFQRLPTGYGFR